jgi:hypothetical protein
MEATDAMPGGQEDNLAVLPGGRGGQDAHGDDKFVGGHGSNKDETRLVRSASGSLIIVFFICVGFLWTEHLCWFDYAQRYHPVF